MAIRIAINGFGRIGRLIFRSLIGKEECEIVAVNDLVPADNLAYLLQYDTVHGMCPFTVSACDNRIVVNEKETVVLGEKDPSRLPWKELRVDFVLESTGLFTSRESAGKHLDAGASKVIITAPAGSDIPVFVMGVNHRSYRNDIDHIVSNASCTTNCLAPIVKVLLDNFGIEEGLMSTVHSMTASQPVVDGVSKKDWRGGRSAAQNIIPSSTGAAKAVTACLPQLQGKLTGMAFRVPTIDVSVVDLTVKLSKATNYDAICNAMKIASETEMKGILSYCDRLLVSSDFIGSPYSAIFDRHAGIALNDTFYKVVAWYDNEMAYALRVIDLARYMASQCNAPKL